MTELEKMRAGRLYNFGSPDITARLTVAKRLCTKLQTLTIGDKGYRETLRELIPGIPDSTHIAPPFHCDHGTEIRMGHHTFVNYNCTMLDGGGITIGNHVLIGPNCQLYTPEHPMDYIARRDSVETGKPITIGDDTWLCGGVIVCPGVKIGSRCIIAAGSVVTRDVPDDCMAAGNPAVVKKKLNTKQPK